MVGVLLVGDDGVSGQAISEVEAMPADLLITSGYCCTNL
jgi:hypothetical protein